MNVKCVRKNVNFSKLALISDLIHDGDLLNNTQMMIYDLSFRMQHLAYNSLEDISCWARKVRETNLPK